MNLTKRAAKVSIFNHNYRCYCYNKKTNDDHCLLQFGMNCNSTETMSTERWKQLETKTKDWKVLDKFGRFWQKNETRKTGKFMRVSTFSGRREFKHTWSLSKMNCCVFNYLRLLKLDLLFRTRLLLIWCIIFHVGEIT